MLKGVEGCPQRTCEQLWKRNDQVQLGGQSPSSARSRAQAKRTCPLARKRRPVFVSRAFQYLFCNAAVRDPRPAQCALSLDPRRARSFFKSLVFCRCVAVGPHTEQIKSTLSALEVRCVVCAKNTDEGRTARVVGVTTAAAARARHFPLARAGQYQERAWPRPPSTAYHRQSQPPA